MKAHQRLSAPGRRRRAQPSGGTASWSWSDRLNVGLGTGRQIL